MKKVFALCASLSLMALSAVESSAHVVVSPASTRIGAFQTFVVGVPVEKDQPTVGVRLLIPEGLDFVMPNVKPGWTIQVKKSGPGESQPRARVSEIEWSGGVIPVGQRDEFIFSAKAPPTETTLQWKAYQRYRDGSVVSWDGDPKALQPVSDTGRGDFSKSGPFSQTGVVNDLKAAAPVGSDLPLWLSAIALALSAVSVLVAWSRGTS